MIHQLALECTWLCDVSSLFLFTLNWFVFGWPQSQTQHWSCHLQDRLQSHLPPSCLKLVLVHSTLALYLTNQDTDRTLTLAMPSLSTGGGISWPWSIHALSIVCRVWRRTMDNEQIDHDQETPPPVVANHGGDDIDNPDTMGRMAYRRIDRKGSGGD